MRFLRDITIAVLFFGFIFVYLLQSPKNSSTREIFIAPGASFQDIVRELKTRGLIQSQTAFAVYSFLSGSAHTFKAGGYIVSSPLSVPRLVDLLVEGPHETPIIISPGMTLREIDDRLSASYIIRPGELILFDKNSLTGLRSDYPWFRSASTLQGFLFPDTYNFIPLTGAEVVVRKVLDNFENKALTSFGDNDNLLRVLIVASLLEKEVPDYQDQRIVTGILEKRLRVGMPLQVDATVRYVQCGERFLNCPSLKYSDYAIQSPYNTYRTKNLPPQPISNPGIEAIRAAMNPAKSPYWYYLSHPISGKTIFSTTLDEHNTNRAKYLLKR